MAGHELLERLAATTEGNALAHFRALHHSLSPSRVWTKDEMLAASGYAIAASYWSLIDSAHAAATYWTAASIYRARGHAYWMPLALASSRADVPLKVSDTVRDAEAAPPVMLAFAMVGDALLPERRASAHLDGLWRHAGNMPVGRLGIPLGYYRRCAEAMALRRPDRFREEARTYLRRMSETMDAAAHDRFHWEGLHSAVLPAEPEAAAMTAAMSRVAHDRFESSLREMVPERDEHMRRVMQAGEGLDRAAAGAGDLLEEALRRAAELAMERDDPTHDDEVAKRVAQLANLLPDGYMHDRLEGLIHEYDNSRGGDWVAIAAKMRALALTTFDRLPELIVPFYGQELFRRHGRALAAVSILELRPMEEALDWLPVLFQRGIDSFVLEHAAWAFVRAARDLPRSALPKVFEAVHSLEERGRWPGRMHDILARALAVLDERERRLI